MFAVLETGGKQYRIERNSIITVEKLEGENGNQLELDKVLLLSTDDSTLIGHPYIANTIVKATILDQFKSKKVRVYKMKPRKRYRRTRGHRQNYTKLRIDDIQVSA